MSDSIAHRRARLRLDPTAWVAPGAVVVGDVALGARSSVWFNTVLRGDTDRIEVGEDSNLQDNSVVHMDEGAPALIGSRVTFDFDPHLVQLVLDPHSEENGHRPHRC